MTNAQCEMDTVTSLHCKAKDKMRKEIKRNDKVTLIEVGWYNKCVNVSFSS